MEIEDTSSVLAERIKGVIDSVNTKFDAIHEKLVSIETQTTKTNGGLTEAKKEIVELKIASSEHVLNCPVKKEFDNYKSDMVLQNWFVRNPKKGIAAFIAVVVIVAFFVVNKVREEVILNSYKKELKIDYRNLILTIDSVRKETMANSEEK